MTQLQYTQHIRDILFYTKKHAKKKIIFFVDVELCNSQTVNILVSDIVRMLDVGIQAVLVPGLQCDDPKNINDKEIIKIQNASFDIANNLITQFATHRQAAVIGNWIRARGHGIVNDIDYQYNGHVEKIDEKAITKLLDDNVVPIIPAIGWSYIGKPYYINPKDITVQMSIALQAQKIFFLLQEDIQSQIQQDLNKKESHRMTVREAKNFLENTNNTQKEYVEMIQRSVLALTTKKHSNLARIHILGGKQNIAFLNEIFSNDGIGFMIYSDEYDSIVAMQQEDIPSILELMRPYVKKNILVNRSAEDLAKQQDDFVVYKADGNIRGVIALHDLGDSCAEIAALVVTDSSIDENRETGIGKKLMTFAIQKAREKNYDKTFVFTLKTGDWFERMGFLQVDPHKTLPKKRLEKYINMARNSRVYCINNQQ